VRTLKRKRRLTAKWIWYKKEYQRDLKFQVMCTITFKIKRHRGKKYVRAWSDAFYDLKQMELNKDIAYNRAFKMICAIYRVETDEVRILHVWYSIYRWRLK